MKTFFLGGGYYYAELCFANIVTLIDVIMPSVVMSSVIMPSVMAPILFKDIFEVKL
jgi:hypothetical protein